MKVSTIIGVFTLLIGGAGFINDGISALGFLAGFMFCGLAQFWWKLRKDEADDKMWLNSLQPTYDVLTDRMETEAEASQRVDKLRNRISEAERILRGISSTSLMSFLATSFTSSTERPPSITAIKWLDSSSK